MPRPLKLTDEKKRRLLRLVMLGASVERAAGAVGCTARTVERAAVRDEDFRWRLSVARGVRETQRRREREATGGESVTAMLARRLAKELRVLWALEEEHDITAKSDAA